MEKDPGTVSSHRLGSKPRGRQESIYLSAHTPSPYTHALPVSELICVADSGWQAHMGRTHSPSCQGLNSIFPFEVRVSAKLGSWDFLEGSVSLLGTSRAPLPTTSA